MKSAQFCKIFCVNKPLTVKVKHKAGLKGDIVAFSRFLIVFSLLWFSYTSESNADHSASEWHLLESETTMDVCKRILGEGKVVGTRLRKNGGYETILYFGGSLYQAEYHFGLLSISCRSYRISPTTRRLSKPG